VWPIGVLSVLATGEWVKQGAAAVGTIGR